MKSLFYALILLLVSACSQTNNTQDANKIEKVKYAQTEQAANQNFAPTLRNVDALFKSRTSKVQVEDSGIVSKLLKDDMRGLKHQKFLVKVASGQVVLIVHNIDLAGRLDNIAVGDTVEFRGEYVYNEKGGLVHWTHHDPQKKHYAGWIKHNGHTYEWATKWVIY